MEVVGQPIFAGYPACFLWSLQFINIAHCLPQEFGPVALALVCLLDNHSPTVPQDLPPDDHNQADQNCGEMEDDLVYSSDWDPEKRESDSDDYTTDAKDDDADDPTFSSQTAPAGSFHMTLRQVPFDASPR